MTQQRLDGTGTGPGGAPTVTVLDNICHWGDGTVRVMGPRSQAVDTLDRRVRILEAENADLKARNARLVSAMIEARDALQQLADEYEAAPPGRHHHDD